MKLSLTNTFLLALAALPSLSLQYTPSSKRQENNTTEPGAALVNYGILLFPAFDLVDIAGALEALQFVALSRQRLNLYIISATGPGPISMAPVTMNAFNSSFWPSITATHGVAEARALDLDVLMVPGGPGVRNANGTQPLVDFIRDKYESLDYLLTICTGAGLAARAGVLDGKNATTNKNAWNTIRAMGPDVNWIAPARFVRDGNVWSSSGVTAGFDMMYEFIKEMHGEPFADKVHNIMEYDPRPDDFDPWTDRYNITHTV
jgi:transcriptional regulator GlxA family with amidase domain